jgi:hypothetical protein
MPPGYNRKKRKIITQELFCKIIIEGLLSDARQDIQGQTESVSASKLTRRDYFLY